MEPILASAAINRSSISSSRTFLGLLAERATNKGVGIGWKMSMGGWEDGKVGWEKLVSPTTESTLVGRWILVGKMMGMVGWEK